MTERIYNFSAGPATLPVEVLEKAQSELLSLNGIGMSVMEISHRSKHFDAIMSNLENEFELYSLNFDGHGGLDSNNPFSIQLFTKNVVDFINANQLNGINIFGHSLGGYVALNVALQNPSLVNRVITLGTKLDWSITSVQREIRMLIPEMVEEKVPQFADRLRQDHHPNDWKIIMRKIAVMMKEMAEGKRIKFEDFEQIKQKVTIGLGSLDNMVTLEESQIIVNKLPNATLVILDNIPHPIDKADPTVIANYIRTALIQ